MRLYGILSVEEPDVDGELLPLEGMDLMTLKEGRAPLTWGFDQNPENVVGLVKMAYVIRPEDKRREPHFAGSEDDQLLQLAGNKPFVKVVARLYESTTQGRFVQNALNNGQYLYFGAGGTCLEREGATLTKTVIRTVALTLNPVSKKHRVFVE